MISSSELRAERLVRVNELMILIGSCSSRGFFSRDNGFEQLELVGRRVYFLPVAGARVNLGNEKESRKRIMHGSTLRGLLAAFRHHILTGEKLTGLGTRHWAYTPVEVEMILATARRLGILADCEVTK